MNYSLPCSRLCTIVFLVLLGSLFWAPEAGMCGQLRGTVTLVNESSIKKKVPDMSEHCRFTGNPGKFTLRDTLTINLCMENGKTTVAPGRRTFKISGDQSSKYQCEKTKCMEWKDGHVVGVERSPGHQWQVDEHYVYKLYRGREWSPSKRTSGVQFMPLFSEDAKPEDLMKYFTDSTPVKGRYQIMASGEDYVGTEGDMTTRHKDPCAHKTTTFTLRMQMTDPSKEPTHWVDNPRDPQLAIATVPAGLWPLAGTWEMDFDPMGCAGSKVIDKDENHVLWAEWEFKVISPCDDVKQAIDHDLTYAEGYLYEGTRKHSMDKYKCYVDRWVYEKTYGRPPDPGKLDCEAPPDPARGEAQGVGDELGVDSDCILVGEEEYRQQAAGNCTPDGLVNGVMAHEMAHVKQCKEQHERYNSDDPAIWGDMEVEAHLAGVQPMINWMQKNCPESDVKMFAKRMESIRKQLSN